MMPSPSPPMGQDAGPGASHATYPSAPVGPSPGLSGVLTTPQVTINRPGSLYPAPLLPGTSRPLSLRSSKSSRPQRKFHTLHRTRTWPNRSKLPTGPTNINVGGGGQSLTSDTASDISASSYAPSVHAELPPISPKPQTGIDQVTNFWEAYNRKADFEDGEFVKALGASLDVLLIFAGLFSGVNTAFILESMKSLQTDQAEKTNLLLQAIVLILQNAPNSGDSIQAEPFAPTPQSVRSSSIFFASLTCSLSAAFGAVLGKQWLNHYEREGALKPPPERARERQKKFLGRDKWHLEQVIEILPAVLQLSLYLFLIALTDFLWPLNRTVAKLVVAFALVPFLFHSLTTTIAIADPSSPFQTGLSLLLRKLHLATLLHRSWKQMRGGFAIARRAVEDRASYRQGTRFSNLRRGTESLLVAAPRYVWYGLREVGRLVFRLPSQVKALLSRSSLDPSLDTFFMNLGCLTFAMKRMSTQEDVDLVMAAMETIQLEKPIEHNHPVLDSFVDTMFHFLLKPTWAYTPGLQWGSASIDFRKLLNALFIIFVQCNYNPIPGPIGENANRRAEYVGAFFRSIQKELWNVFSEDTTDPHATSQIAAVVAYASTQVPHSFPKAQLNLLVQRLAGAAPTPELWLPYLDLLRVGVGHEGTDHLSDLLKTHDIKQALLSGMQVNRNPDLDFDRGRLRLERLVIDYEYRERLGEIGYYLLKWFEENATSPDHATNDNTHNGYQLVETYLKVLCKLMDVPEYMRNLAMNRKQAGGHHSCLTQIALGKIALPLRSDDDPPPGNPAYRSKLLRHFNVLYCLMRLWELRKETDSGRDIPVEEIQQTMSAVTELSQAHNDQLDEWDTDFIQGFINDTSRQQQAGQTMKSMLQFIDTHRTMLLAHGARKVITGCIEWCELLQIPKSDRIRLIGGFQSVGLDVPVGQL